MRTSRPLLSLFSLLVSFFAANASTTASSVTLTASPSPSTYGQTVTLTATVTSGATGAVTFYDGAIVLGTGRIAGGTATLSTPSLASGKRRLRAYYQGDSNFAPSTSAVFAQTVQAVSGNVLGAMTWTLFLPSFQLNLATADFNNDGMPDIVWATYSGAGIILSSGFMFTSSRTISSGWSVPGTHSIAIGDFNGDGKLDIALAQQNSTAGVVQILLGNGDGTFQTGVALNVATNIEGIAAGDFNGDGKVDLVVTEWTKASVYQGVGDGTFLPPVQCVTGNALIGVAVGDFNGDGNADLVFADSNDNYVKVLLGNGDGTFQAPVLFSASYPGAVLVADFNQDGLDDIAIGTGTLIEIVMGTSDGAMRYNGVVFLPSYVNSLLAKGDFNGDGKIDLVAGIQTGLVEVLPGNGDGTFGAGIQYPLSNPYPVSVIEGDFNGDGRTDIAVALPSTGLVVLYGASATMTASGTPQNGLLGTAFASPLNVTVQDANGNPVSGVTVSYSTPTAGPSAVLSSSTAVTAGGVASVTATANNTIGSYTVSASAGQLSASFSLTNIADLPASLTALSGTPQSAAAGTSFSIPLKAVLKNSAGLPVSGATISFSGPASILLSAATVTTDSTGTAEIWATAATPPGTYTVTAANSTLSATFTLTVLQPVAITLATSPNPSHYGQPVTLTARVPSGVTGKVTFYDGIAVLGTTAIQGQTATLSTILLPPGAQKLSALYMGDSSHPATRTSALYQTVTPTPNSSFTFGSLTPIGETYIQSRHPHTGVIGDFNGDGKADLAVANSIANGAGNVSVLLGNGDATFRPEIRCAVGGEADVIATGDFNGDGKADLAVGILNGGMTILLGNGDGSMTVAATYAIGNLSSIVVTDLNRDGISDLVALDNTTGNLIVLFGNGDGTFQTPVTYSTGGPYATSLVVADFNGDGVPDFVLTHGAMTSNLTVFMGNPDGTLQAVQQYPLFIYPWYLAAGDFNGDGKMDLIAVGTEDWEVLTGNGDGTFSQSGLTYYSTWTEYPMVADFNGDGNLDVALIYGNSGSEGVLFLFGSGAGAFQSPVSYTGTSSYAMVGAGDFTGEGKADLALLDMTDNSALLLRDPVPVLGISLSHSSYFWQGLFDATYTLTVNNNLATATTGVITVTDTLPASLTATGLVGTGWTCDVPSLTCTRSDSLAAGSSYPPITLTVDVATTAPGEVINSASVSIGGTISGTASDPTSIAGNLRPTSTSLTVSPDPANLGQSVTLIAQTPAPAIGLVVFYDGATVLGSATLNLVNQTASITTAALPAGTNLLRAYYRGDGVDAPSASPVVSLTVRTGSSQGFASLSGYTAPGNAYCIAAGDFNGDGKADLAIANGSGVSVLFGSGNATFQPPVNYTAARASQFVAAADLNGDGKTDLVTVNPSTNDVTVFVANADGSFQAGVNYPVGTAPSAVAIGDLDGDGFVDLAVANSGSGSLTILLGNGDGTFRQFASYSVGVGPYAVAIGDFNGDSKPDLAVTNSNGFVSILIAKGGGSFQAPSSYAVGNTPIAIAIGDFNDDGNLDLAVANAYSNNVSVLIGNGGGTFRSAVSYAAGGSPADLVIGDFNGDGALDLAVANVSNAGATVIFGKGDGTFGASQTYALGSSATSLVAADFSGKGRLDLAITIGNSAITTSSAPRDIGHAVTGPNNVLILQGGAVPATVQMTNVTRGSSTSFLVGDSWRIAVSGAPNQTVTVTGTSNGSAWGPVNMGQTDGSGNFSVSGAMTSGSVATYTETWSVGGVQANPVLAFTVSVPATVQIVNLTRSASTSFAVGDGWRVNVTGTPNQSVIVSGTTNGSAWGPVTMGQTDSSGNFSVSSAMSSGAIGSYTEIWSVGGVQANTALSFTVSATAPTVQMSNVSRPGSTPFQLGDAWKIAITGGAPNQTVTVIGTSNGAAWGPVTMGQTDASGSFSVSGTMTSGSVATYTEIWLVGGLQASVALSFTVAAPTAPTVQMSNVSRPGSTPYQVGDSWKITITGGAPNQTVSVTGTSNGNGWGPVNMGQTDGSGSFTVTGSMSAGSVSNYFETWSVGGVQAAGLTFAVVPAVRIANTTRGGSASFQVGDGWQVTIQGAPNQTVAVSGTSNGSPWGPVNMGQTDANGNFTISGTMGPGSSASYAETWSAGGIPANPVLSFIVN